VTAQIIGIGGRLRAGKDTVADVLAADHGFRKMGMSDALADALLVLDPVIPDWPAVGTATRYVDVVHRAGYVEAKQHPEVRRLLQKLGTELGRDMIHENVWVDMVERRLRANRAAGVDTVITGIRFPNEVDMIRRIGGTLAWVTRPGTETTAAHSSETSVTVGDFDVLIRNTGTLDDLEAKAHLLVSTVPSSIDEALPPPMFDLAGDTPHTDGPRSSGWYGGTE